MSLILNIDTSTENASICLAENDKTIYLVLNDIQKDHAAWLHPAINDALLKTGKKIGELSAVGVTAGPGSYTGLRVGMATAKGLCFALNIPLIAVNTLDAMARVAAEENTEFICPMIDARRMEVFTALYYPTYSPIIPPCAMILDEKSFSEILQQNKITFFGNGSKKFEELTFEKNAVFKKLIFNASHVAVLTHANFLKCDFSDLVTTEPFYLKEYYTLFISKS